MTACVKSSKIVVSIKIDIRTIKIRVPNKQLVHDQKWDILARTIVQDIGYYQIKKKCTYTHEQSSMIEDIIEY